MRLDRLSSPILFGATPVHVTPEGFRHYEGTATIGDVILPYLEPTPHLEFRPAEEVLSPEAVASMVGVPITNNHPAALLCPDTAKAHTEGAVITAVREEAGTNGAEHPRLRVRVIVYTAPLQELIEAGKVELSPGYNLEEDPTPGSFKGQEYHMVQRRVRYNHLAVVDRARTRTPTGEVARLDEDDIMRTDKKNPGDAQADADKGTNGKRSDAAKKDGLSPEALAAIESWSEEDKAMMAEYIKCYEAEEAEEVAEATGATPEEAEAAEAAVMNAGAEGAAMEGNMDMKSIMDEIKALNDRLDKMAGGRADSANTAAGSTALGTRLDVDAITRSVESRVAAAVARESAVYLRDFNTVRRDSADVLGEGVTHSEVVTAMMAEIKAHTPAAYPMAERALKASRADAGRLDDVRDFYRLAIAAKKVARADAQEQDLAPLAGGDDNGVVPFSLPGRAI